MTADARDVLIDFRTRFEESGGDLRLDAYLRERGLADDDLLADIIAADARLRRERGVAIRLSDYLSILPDLTTRTIPLDAAVEAALRSSLDDGATTVEAVDRLSNEHPALRTLIQEAAVLGRLLPTDTRARGAETGPTFAPGDEIGEPMEDGRRRYAIRERIGAGVQGEVHLATDRRLSGEAGESLVAIKALRRLDDDETRRRFIEEAARARRIDHPNVVRALDRGAHEAREFIVFDYVPGGTLEEHVRSRGGRLPMREAARLISAVARGVQAAHASGLVHGDLKPGNVILTEAGEPKVADFGVAALHRPERQDAPSDGLQGNLAFMAPEQFRMEGGARSPLVDVYALGGMLYWAVKGRPPRGSSLADIIASHSAEEGPAKEGDLPDVDLDLIVRRALSHAPKDRQSSAGSLADDLDLWLDRRPIRWTRPPASHRLRLWLRRSPLNAVGILLMTSALIAFAVVAWRQAGSIAGLHSDLVAAGETIEADRAFRAGIQAGAREVSLSLGQREELGFNTRGAFELVIAEFFVFGEGGVIAGIADAHAEGRRLYLERCIERAESEQAHMLATLYRMALGTCLLEDGDYTAASSVLAIAEETLARWTDDDDPALILARSLMAAGTSLSAEQRDEPALRDLASRVEHGVRLVESRDRLLPVLHAALRILYGPDMLDDPARLAALDAAGAAAPAATSP